MIGIMRKKSTLRVKIQVFLAAFHTSAAAILQKVYKLRKLCWRALVLIALFT